MFKGEKFKICTDKYSLQHELYLLPILSLPNEQVGDLIFCNCTRSFCKCCTDIQQIVAVFYSYQELKWEKNGIFKLVQQKKKLQIFTQSLMHPTNVGKSCEGKSGGCHNQEGNNDRSCCSGNGS